MRQVFVSVLSIIGEVGSAQFSTVNHFTRPRAHARSLRSARLFFHEAEIGLPTEIREERPILDPWYQRLRSATSTIFSLTSGVRRCQLATSSRKGKSVQAVCRQERGSSTQLAFRIMTCGSGAAGAIPAASISCVISHLD
jgi:hypothetical protein